VVSPMNRLGLLLTKLVVRASASFFSVVDLLKNLQFCNEFPTNFSSGESGVVSCVRNFRVSSCWGDNQFCFVICISCST
jgi:hypothetical protein